MRTITIEDVTDRQIDTLVEKLQAGGAEVTSPDLDQWRISGHRIVAIANYFPERFLLTVAVESKPWYVSMSRIESTLRENLLP